VFETWSPFFSKCSFACSFLATLSWGLWAFAAAVEEYKDKKICSLKIWH
jgi:hypothetical protein